MSLQLGLVPISLAASPARQLGANVGV